MRGLVGVGVGPGDPELVTGRAARVLREADRVFAPAMDAATPGRAETIAAAAVPGLRIERLVFAITGTDDEQRAAHDAAAAEVVVALDREETVAFVTLGDPNMYSTFADLAGAVVAARPFTPVTTVPGVMAFQDLAARSGVVALDGNERLVLVSAAGGVDEPLLAAALADPSTTIVVYKGGRHLPQLAAMLAAAGRLDGAVVGELLGLPGERVVPVRDAGERPAGYLATVLVPPVRAGS
jgi:precorrin-2/cobalt-factor-2 C20-methyltransferase